MAKIDAYQGVRVFLTKKARKDKKNPDAPAEKLSKLGKIHMSVFSPNGRQLVGFLVARPDVVGMVKREDAFLAWDSFEPCERGIVVTRPDDGLGDAARKRLGLDWDKCIMWAGMDARTRSGKVLGYVNDVEFDLKTGRAKTFYIGDGGMARALVGSFEIPAEMVIGYSAADQFMVVSDDAENLAVDGGVAAQGGHGLGKRQGQGRRGRPQGRRRRVRGRGQGLLPGGAPHWQGQASHRRRHRRGAPAGQTRPRFPRPT